MMKNKTIAILENRAGEQLADLVRKYGGTPFLAPALAEIADIDTALITQMVSSWQLHQPDIFIFQTGVGVKALFATTDSLGITPQMLQVFAAAKIVVRGPKPTAILKSRNVRIDLTAGDPYTTHEVLGLLDLSAITNKNIVVQRYGDTNVDLQNALQASGAKVKEITTYRWSLPADIAPLHKLIDKLAAKTVDMVCFTSASQVFNLFTVASQSNQTEILAAGLSNSLVASIGPVCTQALQKFAVRVDVEASPPKLGPFIQAINEQFA